MFLDFSRCFKLAICEVKLPCWRLKKVVKQIQKFLFYVCITPSKATMEHEKKIIKKTDTLCRGPYLFFLYGIKPFFDWRDMDFCDWAWYDLSMWWFQVFYVHPDPWGNDPISLLFFNWVVEINEWVILWDQGFNLTFPHMDPLGTQEPAIVTSQAKPAFRVGRSWGILGAIMMMILLMDQKSQGQPTGCNGAKTLVNNGRNHLSLNWWSPDFWTINRMIQALKIRTSANEAPIRWVHGTSLTFPTCPLCCWGVLLET